MIQLGIAWITRVWVMIALPILMLGFGHIPDACTLRAWEAARFYASYGSSTLQDYRLPVMDVRSTKVQLFVPGSPC